MSTILKNQPQSIKINKQPYVLLPLDVWEDLEDQLLMNNPKIKKEVLQAEEEIKQGKVISFEEYHHKRMQKTNQNEKL